MLLLALKTGEIDVLMVFTDLFILISPFIPPLS